MRPRLEILEERVTPSSGFNTATPLTTQDLAPSQTSYLNLSQYFADPATTNGTVVTFNTSQGSFNVTLFDADAPQTVTNFLDYVQSGAYNDDVFNRMANLNPSSPNNAPYQVLQGGGYTANLDPYNNVTAFNSVTTFQPIASEANDALHPNKVGTLAMALGNGANGATSQFFFNLTDNSQALGNGYTVFGAVTDSTGLTALQNFANNYTPNDVSTAVGNDDFSLMPLVNGFTPASNFPTGATAADLAIINSVTVAQPPSGHLTYQILNDSDPSVVTATLGSDSPTSTFSDNQLQLVAGSSPGSAVITLKITDQQGVSVTDQFTVVVAATNTTVVADANPSVSGQAVTFTATVAAASPGSGTPTGSVTFMDGSTPLGTRTLDGNGQATLTTSSLSTTTHSITVVYSGSPDFFPSTSSVLSQVVGQDGTSTSLGVDSEASFFGQMVTFTATVTADSPGSGQPTGTVTFMDGTTTLGTRTLSGGQATFSISNLAPDFHAITAIYAGDASFLTSRSANLLQGVNVTDTTTTVNASALDPHIGRTVSFTATVSPVAPGAGAPTGTVTFMEGTTTLGIGTLAGGSATFSISALALGVHPVTAVYSGNADFAASTSATDAAVTVGPASASQPTLSAVAGGASPVVFVIGANGALYQYLATTGWTAIGAAGTVESISATTQANGSVVLFALCTDHALSRYVVGLGWDGVLGAANTIRQISAGLDRSGQADVFVVNSSTGLDEWSTSAGWQSLPNSPAGVATQLSAVNSDRVYVVTANQSVYGHDPNLGWFALTSPGLAQSISATDNGQGSATVYALTTTGALYRHDDATGWNPVGAPGTIAAISAGRDVSNQADVFAITTTGQLAENDTGSGWITLNPPSPTAKMSATLTDGLFAVLADGSIDGYNSTLGFYPLTSPGFAEL